MENCIALERRGTSTFHTKFGCAGDTHTAIRPYIPTSRSSVIPISAASGDEMEKIFNASIESTACRKEYNKQIGVLIQEEFDLSCMMSYKIEFEVPDSQVDTIPFACFLNEK